uniref:Diacylglycerol kinase n=1 Tax=Salmo trutta TaxID=8032 RepID=A0A673WBE6_SALTR
MENVYHYTRSPAWEELEPEKGPSTAGIHAHVVGAVGGSGAVDESSDSEGEQEGPQKLIRKVSTSGQLRSKTSVKEGLLLKQTSSFQRWKKRYFKLRGRTLYYAKDAKSLIFDEVDLSDASVAESSTKNVNNSFTVITPFRRLILCAENRKEMEDWISSLKSVQSREHYETAQFNVEHFSGMHNWYACSHARPTFCNVCRDSLSGVTSHGLSCEVCKFKAHKRCAVRATNNCKWTTLASIGKDIIEDEDGIAMPHQWLEGNLPVSAKCAVCDKTCGSVLRLQDWRCLWCKAMVSVCMWSVKCPLGQCKVSIIPPTALNSIDSDGFWKATCPPSCASPLLVFVNSKSGDNQGVKFLRRFKQLLNPAQVFDLVNGGPHLGLRLFQKFDNFRILVCGGDGSVGWVLSEIDKLNLHKQCQLGVLPLGTGNDLARVLGWGPSCDDDTQLPQILEKLERASTKMLDRWSIMTYEIKLPSKHSGPVTPDDTDDGQFQISAYEDSVTAHLTKILNSDQHSVVISSAKILCETVKDFVAKVGKSYEKSIENTEECDTMSLKCAILNEKLDSLLQTLNTEAQSLPPPLPLSTPPIKLEAEESEKGGEKGGGSPHKLFRAKEQLMLRANSLKKAVRQIIEQAERGTAHTTHTQHSLRKSLFLCIGLRAGLAASIAGSSIISKMLLANIDPFGATEGFSEKCVMNNYFGVGLDAKITLEFNNKREEHPEKCRSRTKNRVWYGVLGTKELLQRTYKNLEQKVQLECDGQYIPLPSLQGIAVLNIPSYAGGTNFWGGTKEDDIFCAPSFDDKILEVVAVFGSMQMAVSRVIKLQHHRIAQCRSVKITILGDEGVPIQVDGEAWVQPPGVIKIQHKNRAQMLTRDRVSERWREGGEVGMESQSGRKRGHAVSGREYAKLTFDPYQRATSSYTASVQKCILPAQLVCVCVCVCVHPQQLEPSDEESLSSALQSVEMELGKLVDIPWLYHILQPNEDEDPSLEYGKRNSRSSMFRIVPKFKKEKATKKTSPQWGTEEVGVWLEQLSLGEYRDTFTRHDIRGSELLHLERRDLKVHTHTHTHTLKHNTHTETHTHTHTQT